MQQRGMSFNELMDLPNQMYELYFTFCEFIEPRSSIQDAINTALLMQSVYQSNIGKPIDLHELHYLIPESKTKKEKQENKKFTLADAKKWLDTE